MKIGILGLGIVGSRVAENYRKAGFDVHVWSRTPRETPGYLESPKAVASESEFIQIFVNDGSSLLAALEEMKPVLGPQHIIVNSATVSLEATQKAASLVEAAGAQFLDCPFTGSKDAAGAGQLVYYVGGDSSLLEKVRPLLVKSSKEIMHFGKIGDATVLKIATNMVSAATVQILSEAIAVTNATGISTEQLAKAMEGNANCSGLIRMKLGSILRDDFGAHFSLKNMLKDSLFGLDIAEEKSLDLPVLKATSECMADLADKGHSEEDFSVLVRKYL